MPIYRANEAEFLLPEQAQDQSVQIFAFYGPDGNSPPPPMPANAPPPEFSVVVSRDAAEDDETVDAFINRQLEVLQTSLPDFRLRQRGFLLMDGAQAVTIEYTWKSENSPLYQRQASVRCPPAPHLPTPTFLTLTGTALEGRHEQYESVFQQLLFSLKFRR